jgi:transcriptional regulator with XRE-family HTH domain
MGLLSAQEIREIRLRLGRTQAEMSHLLGVGAKTYCRWESGSFLQSLSFDNYLRLIRDVPEASLMLIHIEKFGVSGGFRFGEQEETEFTFLTDIGSLTEPASKFTEQLVMGTLHACV